MGNYAFTANSFWKKLKAVQPLVHALFNFGVFSLRNYSVKQGSHRSSSLGIHSVEAGLL